MDTFFLNELKMCCAEINSDRENEDGISRVVDACKRAISFSEMVVNEGMIALDAACDDLDEDKEEIIKILDNYGYCYSSSLNQFIAK